METRDFSTVRLHHGHVWRWMSDTVFLFSVLVVLVLWVCRLWPECTVLDAYAATLTALASC